MSSSIVRRPLMPMCPDVRKPSRTVNKSSSRSTYRIAVRCIDIGLCSVINGRAGVKVLWACVVTCCDCVHVTSQHCVAAVRARIKLHFDVRVLHSDSGVVKVYGVTMNGGCHERAGRVRINKADRGRKPKVLHGHVNQSDQSGCEDMCWDRFTSLARRPQRTAYLRTICSEA